jgi:uncharacterized Zn finger protein
MARTSKHDAEGSKSKKQPQWKDLTWDDLEAWAGDRSVSRGQTYQRQGRVRDLARTEDGRLLAWVEGGSRYATVVSLNAARNRGDRLQSSCTCPVGFDGCKHAVAVVLEYLEALKENTAVPTAPADDRRLELIEAEEDFEEDDFEEEDFAEDDFEEPSPRRARRRRGESEDALRAYLEARPAAELADLILQYAGRFPEVREELQEKRALGEGRMDELVARARRQIADLTSQHAWRNHWSGEGEVPDYSGLQRLLKNLVERGQADAVAELGRGLLRDGLEQVGQSDDEGETAGALARCLGVVFRAVAGSSLTARDKLLYAIDAVLQDDYDVCDGAGEILDAEWAPADWSAVADELARRLRAQGRPNLTEFSDRYRRDRLSNWLIRALERAGRGDEALAVCEAEARVTGSYERLVGRLLDAGNLDDAARWAAEGMEKVGAEWPGVAQHLRDKLRDIAQRRRDWPLVAAYRADDFFSQPGVDTFGALMKATAKAGCEPQVRAAALHFLETNRRPDAAPPPQPRPSRGRAKAPRAAARAAATVSWPLPPLPYPEAGAQRRLPAWQPNEPHAHWDVLIDLAIQDKRPDDVLAWYDRLCGAHRRGGYGVYGTGARAEQVADAVAAAHPDRALAIYLDLAERQIAATNPAAYGEAARHLAKVRKLLTAAGRADEWARILADVRTRNARKRRLMETLDRLENSRIVR